MKINYDLKYSQIIKKLTKKPTLLLHSCCGPCSSASMEKLCQHFNVTVVYYNPNIYPEEEYQKRLTAQKQICEKFNIELDELEYNEAEFLSKVKGLEAKKEGEERCTVCFALRLEKVASLAKQKGYDYFGTTLTISPHKNEQIINELGEALGEKYEVKFLPCDLKKHDGFKRSIQLSKQFNLYRQNYCGCRFSLDNTKVEEQIWAIQFMLKNLKRKLHYG